MLKPVNLPNPKPRIGARSVWSKRMRVKPRSITRYCSPAWPFFRCKPRSEEHTSELQSQSNLVCRLLLEKKKNNLYETSTRPHPPAPITASSIAHCPAFPRPAVRLYTMLLDATRTHHANVLRGQRTSSHC